MLAELVCAENSLSFFCTPDRRSHKSVHKKRRPSLKNPQRNLTSPTTSFTKGDVLETRHSRSSKECTNCRTRSHMFDCPLPSPPWLRPVQASAASANVSMEGGPRRAGANPENVGASKWSPQGWGLDGQGARRVGRQGWGLISRFFFLSPPQFFNYFFPLSCGSSRVTHEQKCTVRSQLQTPQKFYEKEDTLKESRKRREL